MASIFNIIKKSTGKDSPKEKVLLMGAEGMLGQDLHEELAKRYEVAATDLKDGDITLLTDVKRLIGKERPRYIVNAFGYTKVDDAEREREEAFKVNAAGVGNLARAAKEKGALLVHFSTDYIFDGTKRTPYLEDDEPSPANYYGETKWQGEKEILASGAEYLIIRTQWLYGLHGKNFVFSIVDTLKRKGIATVVDDQWGCPTFTRDLATATSLLMSAGERGVFHFSGEGETTWYHFAKAIADMCIPEDVVITPVKTSEVPRPAPRPAYAVLSKNRFSSHMGKAPRDWKDMLADFLKAAFEGGVAW